MDLVSTGVTEQEEQLEAQVLQAATLSPQEKAYNEAASKKTKCPDCKVLHHWDKPTRDGKVKWPSDQFRSCPRYNALTPEEKGRKIESVRGCPKCTSWAHEAKDCWDNRPLICRKMDNGVQCNKPHHSGLHSSKSHYCSANVVVNASINDSGEIILLGMQQVQVKTDMGDGTAILFYDGGSTITLCRHDWARSHGLTGRPLRIYIKVLAQKYEAVVTVEYQFHILDTQGIPSSSRPWDRTL